MKAKYLFYSLALASAFTACTQEELVNAPVQEGNDLANRPVAGVVTFVGDEVESRYNKEAGTFQKGDEMGVYLMDEFKEEEGNANTTAWDYQTTWWSMYRMVSYISTNYGYEYEGNGIWVNRASQLVEGNYIAMFPQNKLATNRRDLWHPINANVDMKAHSTKKRYFVGRDNQFFVGYEQIKRDQETDGAGGELKANISMKPILTYGRMKFNSDMSENVKLKKVVFRHKNKSALPNIAYVNPENIVMNEKDAKEELGMVANEYVTTNKRIDGKLPSVGLSAPYWAFNIFEDKAGNTINGLASMEQNLANCGTVIEQGIYDRKTFTQDAARSMVTYDVATSSNAPYGMTAAQYAPVYEYTFNFPNGGIQLDGNWQKDGDMTECYISIALPYIDEWDNMEVVVYADRWNDEHDVWEAGYISKKDGADGSVNANWNLNSLPLWDGDIQSELPQVELAFDNGYFTVLNEIEVSSSAEFYNLVKGRLYDANTGKIVDLKVVPYGNGVTVGSDVVKLIDDYKKNYTDASVSITFKTKSGVNAAPVTLAAENSIHKFAYEGVDVILEADQTIEKNVGNITTLTNDGASTLTVKGGTINNVVNNGTMIVSRKVVNGVATFATITTLDNFGDLTLGNGLTIDELTNEPGAVVNATANSGDGKSWVKDMENEHRDGCNTCVKAQLNVTGYLTIDNLTNDAEVNVDGELTLVDSYNNNLHSPGRNDAVLNNRGTVKGIVKNGGVINIGDNTGKAGKFEGTLINEETGLVNAYKSDIDVYEAKPNSVMYVLDEDACVDVQTVEGSSYVIFKGVVPNDGVTTDVNVIKIFELTENETILSLMEKMVKTGATHIKTSKNITFNKLVDENGTNKQVLIDYLVNKIEYIYVDGTDVVFKNEPACDWTWNFAAATLEVKNPTNVTYKLTIRDMTDINVNEVINGQYVHIQPGSHVNGQSTVDHNGTQAAYLTAGTENR